MRSSSAGWTERYGRYTATPSTGRKFSPAMGVAFYKAGEGNKVLLGTAETASAIKGKDGDIDYTVDLSNTVVWKKRVLMKPLVDKLDFVDNKEQWGRYM